MRTKALIVALSCLLCILSPVDGPTEARDRPQQVPASPAQVEDRDEGLSTPGGIEAQWGAHVKFQGTASRPGERSLFQSLDTGDLYDGYVETRLRNKVLFGDLASLETHYEAVLANGDTRRSRNTLRRLIPGTSQFAPVADLTPTDDRRLLDLSATIDEGNGHVLYHRLDRLVLSLQPTWGVVRIGRQAATWGNGLLFNPLDLFNPFSPTDIEKDYKQGDDMASLQIPFARQGDIQLLYVPRRDPISEHVTRDCSSLAGKIHLGSGTTEYDFLAARHYDDTVIGLGSVGYVGGAAWRLDGTWTFLGHGETGGYLALVTNIDYSWVWLEKNLYGFVEFYFNGLCHDRYAEALANRNIVARLDRGELHTLGRTYLSGHIRIELHPLVNIYLTVIDNLEDPSGLVQPRVTWDATQNVEITLGGNIAYGSRGTEYGGFDIPVTPFTTINSRSPDSVFLQLAYFFP